MSVPSFIAEAKQLYIKGNIQDCIEFLDKQLTKDKRSFDLLDLQRRYNSLQRKINRGVISHADEKIELNQINNSLLNLIESLESGQDHSTVATQHTDTKRSLLFVGGGIMLLVVLLYGFFSLQGSPGILGGEESDEAAVEQPAEAGVEQSTDPIDCGKYGKLVDGKCECVNAYTGEFCETRVAPTTHISGFKDQFYYAIESVAIPGWSITVLANGQEPTDYFELQKNSALFNGDIFQLLRSKENDFYRVKTSVRGGGVFTAEKSENPMLLRQFYHQSDNQAFRFLAVGDEGHFSIQPLSHPNLYLTSSGEGGRIFFTERYSDPQTLFKLRAVEMGSY